MISETTPLVKAGPFTRVYNPGVGLQEQWYINDHCFIYDGTLWHMFGITHAEPANPLDEKHLVHATATSLLQPQWKKQPFALSADAGTSGEIHLWAPHVLLHNGLYYIYYCAGDTDNTRYKIHCATSPDLWNWERTPENPMVVDGFDARDPMILRVGDEWAMYYTATSKPAGGNHVVACRTSKDLIRWGERRIVFTDTEMGTYAGPTESPFVVQRGQWYYLFIGPRGGYVGTGVFRSRDPFNWKMEDQVGFIQAHALEVVRDCDGSWYASHCGWGEGGLYLAKLFWDDGLDDEPSSMPAPTCFML